MAYNSFEADQVIALFESNGIPCYKKTKGAGDFLNIYFGSSNLSTTEIYIPQDAEDSATELLEAAGFLEKIEKKSGREGRNRPENC